MIDDSELAQGLLESGLVDRDRLMEVARHRTNERNLYHTLLDHQAIEERDLVRLAGKMLNVPTVRLERISIAPEVLDLVPASMANRNRVIPLSIEKEGETHRLVLGMTDPIDVLAMDEIATHTGIDIRPVLVGPTELEAALIKVYTRRRISQADIPAPDVPVAEINSVDPDDPFADIGELAMEALDNTGWEEFFDDAANLAMEDSAAISQEMRDRPVSGAFEMGDDDDDLPQIDVIEMIGAPSEPQQDDPLEDWEVDDAITNTPTNQVDPVTQRRTGKSQIVSAADAMNLFGDPSPAADSSAELEEKFIPNVDDEFDDVGEPTEKKSLEELSDSGVIDRTGKTSLGVGVVAEDGAAGRAALRAPKAKTAHTDRLRKSDPRASKKANTDYGELGRQILKTEIAKDEALAEEKGDEPPTADVPDESTDRMEEPQTTRRKKKGDELEQKKTDLKQVSIPDDVDLKLLLRGILTHLLKNDLLDAETLKGIIESSLPPES